MRVADIETAVSRALTRAAELDWAMVQAGLPLGSTVSQLLDHHHRAVTATEAAAGMFSHGGTSADLETPATRQPIEYRIFERRHLIRHWFMSTTDGVWLGRNIDTLLRRHGRIEIDTATVR